MGEGRDDDGVLLEAPGGAPRKNRLEGTLTGDGAAAVGVTDDEVAATTLLAVGVGGGCGVGENWGWRLGGKPLLLSADVLVVRRCAGFFENGLGL